MGEISSDGNSGPEGDDAVIVDCDAGRELGCSTFCCRLIVRLNDSERKQFNGVGTFEKSDDGLCMYLDRDTFLCGIWDKRPSVCREYTCNDDKLLQVVLREGFRDLKTLATSKLFIPTETYIRIPTK